MFPSVFAIIAGTAPVALFCTAGILLVARLRPEPWTFGRAGLLAACTSAAGAALLLGGVSIVFGDGLRLVDGLAAAAGGGGQAALCTGIVALGSRLVDRNAGA